MRNEFPLVLTTALFSMVFLGSCKSSMPPTEFVNPDFDFGFVERVAVLPFENDTNDRLASSRATRLTMTELLASGALDVVEPGEIEAAIDQIEDFSIRKAGRPSTAQITSLGQLLQVQAVIIGSVTQSELLRAGQVNIPVVTIDMRMVETETGTVVWAATHSEKGAGISAKILGTGGVPLAETTRVCVQNALATLIE